MKCVCKRSFCFTLLLCFLASFDAIGDESEPKINFEIARSEASKSVRVFSMQARMSLIYHSEDLEGVSTNAISGRFSAQEALAELFEETVITIEKDVESGAFALIRLETKSPKLSQAHSSGNLEDPTNSNPKQHQESEMKKKKSFFGKLLGAIPIILTATGSQATAQDYDEDAYELSPFEIISESENQLWSVNQSTGGTRIATAVKELPFSLEVLTTSFMEDFMIHDMAEALGNVSNSASYSSQTGAGSGNPVRGFSQFYQLRDGFYRNGVVSRTLIERVEVVKGPYAAIYGRSEPGGVINYIPKRPVFGSKFGQISFQIGQNETFRTQIEQNVALGKNTALLFAGSYLEKNYDQIWTHERSVNYGIVLSHRFSDKTKIVFEYENMYRRNNRGRPLADIRIDGVDPSDGTKNKYTGEWAWDFYDKYGWVNTYGPDMFNDRDLQTYNITLNHSFADNVHFRVAYNQSETGQLYNYYANMSSTIFVDPETREFTRWVNVPNPHHRRLDDDNIAIQADLTVEWETGNIEHMSLFTFDYSDFDRWRYRLRAPRGRSSDVHIVDYDGDIPNYTSDAGALHGPRSDVYIDYNNEISFENTPEYYTWLSENRVTNDEIMGLFFLHRARFFDDKLILTGGARYDEATTTITDRLSPDQKTISTETETKVDDLTYNLGANYYLNEDVILFGSYSTSFNPKGNTYSHTGDPMPNEKGVGHEIGVRWRLLDDNLDTGVSYFKINRENISIRNPEFDDEVDSASEKPTHIPGGLDRVKGWELFANGRLTDSLGLRLSVGLVDTEHVKSPAAWMEGMDFMRVPEWNYSVSGRYSVNEGMLKGLRINATYKANGSYRVQERTPSATDLRNNLRTDVFKNLDLSFAYGWGGGNASKFDHTLRLAVTNVLDGKYVIGDVGYFNNARQFHLSYSLKY